jgi:nicotinate-nucleotide adenylyltransferase
MRTLCFGGSFNPIHHGHLICARAVAEAAGFDRIDLVPNQQSPHKAGVADIAPAVDRVSLCRLAVSDDPKFAVDDLETTRPPPSYTIDTVRELKRRGRSQVHWLIGADQLASLPQWHDAVALMAETNFVVMARPGWTFEWDRLPAPFRSLRNQVVAAPLLEISSTDIRQRLRAGGSIRYLTPDAVIDHIRQRRLYST